MPDLISEVAALTNATTQLLNSVNVRKSTLDASVDAALLSAQSANQSALDATTTLSETEVVRDTAQTYSDQAAAAWSAALAANPDLNPWGRMNPATLTADVSLAAGYNAVSAGPLTVGDGVTVTLADTSNWSII